MRVAVISDIHGNLEALLRVLADLESQGVEEVVSLGDNVGYGPQPEEVVRLLRDRGIPSVMGNHELALVSPFHLSRFNPSTRLSLKITKDLLSAQSLAYLGGLPRGLSLHGCRLAHGCPPDSPTTYLFELADMDLADLLARLEEEISFVGHTHLLGLVSLEKGRIGRRKLGEGLAAVPLGAKHLVNAGAVGQPRDGDNRAKYVIWDGDRRELMVRCVEYDIASTASRILALGFPVYNARRLW